MSAGSSFSVVDNTPRFSVAGRDRADLSVRVQRLEIAQDEDGLRWLEGYFVHSGPRDNGEPGFLFEGDAAVPLGATVEVALGDEDNRVTVFSGRVSAIGTHFPPSEPALLRINAEDVMMELRMQRHSNAWADENDGVILTESLRDAHAQVDSPQGSKRPGYLQLNRQPLATLRERARELDRRIGVIDGVVTLTERTPSEPIILRWFNELLSFEASADLAHQRTQVRVHGYARSSKSSVTGVGGNSAVSPESRGGTTGPQALQRLNIDAIENIHIEAPQTQAEADEVARILALRRARSFVSGAGVTQGTPEMQVGSTVDLRGLDVAFRGHYDVVKLRHVFDRQQGLRTHFEVQRVDYAGEVAQ